MSVVPCAIVFPCREPGVVFVFVFVLQSERDGSRSGQTRRNIDLERVWLAAHRFPILYVELPEKEFRLPQLLLRQLNHVADASSSLCLTGRWHMPTLPLLSWIVEPLRHLAADY